MIRRSERVEAPGTYCFPGGAIEPGESEPEALGRELHEELRVTIQPVACLWRSVTPWQVALSWWLAELPPTESPNPNPQEVQALHWFTAEELLKLPGLLVSNHHFLQAWGQGQFTLDEPPPECLR